MKLYFKLTLITCLFLSCSGVQSDDAIIAEAQAFMDGYARDLRASDNVAVASRYHRSGAFMGGNGYKAFSVYDSIQARYEKWHGPDSFEWQDLSYEVISNDAIAVIGKFLWTMPSGSTTYSYTGLLLRQDDELKIRIESESVNPFDLKDFICPPDSSVTN